MKRFFRTCLSIFLAAFACGVLTAPHLAFADNISDISRNISTSGKNMPTLIAGISYLLGLVFAATGILKLKDHVERPGQIPLRESISRFAAGGALLALPTVTQAMLMAIGTGGGGGSFSIFDFASSLFGFLPAALSANFNGILTSILESLKYVPTMLGAIVYLLGLVMAVSGVLKAKEHIDDPSHIPLRESVIRLLIGGAFFALPTVMDAVQTTITGGATTTTGFSDLTTIFAALFGGASCDASAMAGASGVIGAIIGGLGGGGLGTSKTLGDSICGTMAASSLLPHFMTALAYLFGIILVIWGLLKIKEHVLNPSGTPLWDGAIRLIAAGAFFALPYVASVMKNTVFDSFSGLFATFTNTGFDGTTSAGGLDTMMVGFIDNIYGPMLFAMNFFGYIAGTALVMIGISRLLKSSQEGPRGPGGLGTMMTFIAGGALLSISPLLGAFTASLFSGDGSTHTFATVSYSGMSTAELDHLTAMVSSMLQFMIVLGFISFARGIFIIRSVAEGNHQASMVAGMTHMIGGALAVNLGPLLNVLQETFGITSYGITFS